MNTYGVRSNFFFFIPATKPPGAEGGPLSSRRTLPTDAPRGVPVAGLTDDGRVLAEHVVPERRRHHRLLHGRGRLRQGVAPQVHDARPALLQDVAGLFCACASREKGKAREGEK